MSICFLRIITGFLLSHHPRLLADDDVADPTPRTITLSYKLFQGSHVSNLPTTFRAPGPDSDSSRAKFTIPAIGLHLPRELAVHIVELLSAESRALSVSIADVQRVFATLTGQRNTVDSILAVIRVRLSAS